MIASRAYLHRTLSVLRSLDSSAASPFIGMQWGEAQPEFYRSGSAGFLQTIGYTQAKPPNLIVSLSHLRDSLAILPDEELDLSAKNGVCTLSTTKGFHSELRVHTAHPDAVWSKSHIVGAAVKEVAADAFHGISPAFTLSAPPILKAGRLLFPTAYGMVFRDVSVEAFPYPQEGLLRLVSGSSGKVQRIVLSANGYWMASTDQFKLAVAGHRTGDALFALYNVGATSITTLPAERLMQALASAYRLSAESTKIQVAPGTGITVRDEYGQDSRFSLGDISGWESFSIHPKTADVITSALVQGTGDVTLAKVDGGTYRLSRASWEVTFKVFL